ncbi:MAG TPA: hypothetical protein VKY81_01260 [Natronosporangium sp.]|nr:hypothetical protein [Natronosporangium sp.]
MYAWIWRHLPFGLPGKIIGSLLLISAAVATLWFWVIPETYPWIEQVLPFYDSTIETGTGGSGPAPAVGPSEPASSPTQVVGPDGRPVDPHDIPYETDE